jgi:hypothetical protein
MESPPLYRAPPCLGPRPKVPSADSQLGSTNDSDDIYEQLPSDDSEIGSGDALVRPSLVRQRQQQQQQSGGHKPSKMEPSPSDNFVLRDRDFDNLWAGARRSHRELGGGVTSGTTTTSGNTKSQQQAYLAFATGRRSHHSRSVNNNGSATQLRPLPPTGPPHGHGNNVPGRINIAEYSAVTDALARMRLPRTSPPYTNLPSEEYVSDTGHRNRSNRPRRTGGTYRNYL